MANPASSVGPELDRRSFMRVAGMGIAGIWAASVAGCGSNASGSQSVNNLSFFFWGQGTVAQRHVAAIDQFKKQHPGLTVQPQYVNQPSYDAKLSTEIAGGNPPGIFEVAIETEDQYISRGAVRKINDLVPSVLPFNQLPASLQDYCKHNGDWYLIPTGIATKPAVVYNKTALTQLGLAVPSASWTMGDLASLAAKVNSASGGKLYGITDLSGNDWALSPYLRGLGKSLFTKDGKLGFDKNDLASWFEFWDQMRKNKGCGPMSLTVAAGNGKLQTTDEVIKGQAAITLSSSSKGLLGLQSLTKDELGLLPFPKHSSDGPAATVVRPIEWFVLSSKLTTAEAKAAAEFCLTLINDEQALDTLDLAHGVPLFPAVRDKMYPKQTGANKLIFDDVAQGLAENPPTEYPYPPGAPDLINDLGTQAQAIGFGKTTIAKAVDAIFAQAATKLG